jgi:opacity protein-like surface antigen
MNKLLLALLLSLSTSVLVAAQDSSDGYKKGELFVGYSNAQIDTGLGDFSDELGPEFSDRETFHGFNVSGVYNVNRYLGLKADVSGVYNNRGFAFTVPTSTGGTGSIAFETKNSLYNFLGGLQIKNNSNSRRLRPFAHALVGAAHTRTKISGLGCSVGVDCTGIESGSETNFAAAFGGGLDVRLSKRVQLRLIQVDYNPIWFEGGGRQNNLRFGFGLVF